MLKADNLMCPTYIRTHETVTTIKMVNVSVTPKSPPPAPRNFTRPEAITDLLPVTVHSF